MHIDRRSILVAGAGLLAAPAIAGSELVPVPSEASFPEGFLWGAATAGHQVEGNNVASDLWLLEHVRPTVFSEPSGDACNSLELWAQDLDLVRRLGLNTYRFSLEWARIEPEPGMFSLAMLDHYRRMIEGCRERGITPLVTFNHFTCPRWFAAAGGWLNAEAPGLFARYCERAARHCAGGIGYATTLNEPNLLLLLRILLPRSLFETQRANLHAAALAAGSSSYLGAAFVNPEDIDAMTPAMIAAHRAGRNAIKSVRPDLPVGVSLAMFDDQAAGPESLRDAKRAEFYGAWLDAVKGEDFLGVQNYERARWDAHGRLPPPAGARLNWSGSEVYAPSLTGAVRYAHKAAGVPIIVTEHGVGTDDDAIRSALIPEALTQLHAVIAGGVPVRGYLHWSLIDNFEWIFGYKPKYGLCAVNRTTFARTPKPSASVLGGIARRNSVR